MVQDLGNTVCEKYDNLFVMPITFGPEMAIETTHGKHPTRRKQVYVVSAPFAPDNVQEAPRSTPQSPDKINPHRERPRTTRTRQNVPVPGVDAMDDKRNTFGLLVFVSVLVFVYLFSYYATWSPVNPQNLRLAANQNRHQARSAANGTKYVLYWTKMFSSATFHFSDNGSKLFEGCPVDNCFATDDRRLVPVEDYAAILFYAPTKTTGDTRPPERRDPRQRYVYANSEAPVRFTPSQVSFLHDDFYNWTMTYRFDSDIPRRHGYLVEATTGYETPPPEYFRNKTGKVAWVVSNCRTATNRRYELAKKLARHIPVDIFGKCEDRPCPEDCFDMVERSYKFYLSFENSNCKDYTTEKLFKMLQRDLVPVVYGGGDYGAVAPPHSVVNVEDFETAEELAGFLRHLDDNLEEYLRYFEWKKRYKVVTANKRVVCKLCEMLNDPEQPAKTYSSIRQWWFGEDMAGCKVGDQLPPIVFR